MHTCGTGLEVPSDWPLRTELYAQASPVAGAVRIQVGMRGVYGHVAIYPWPLAASPEDYVNEPGQEKSFRIDDAESAAALRQLRELAIADAEKIPGDFPSVIIVDPPGFVSTGDGAPHYALAVRDELPFANSDGKWGPP